MKKNILSLLITTITLLQVSAQCVIDTTHFAGSKYTYPDTLPCIIRNASATYDTTLQIKVPLQANANAINPIYPQGLMVGVDSIKIDSVIGFPLGISYVMNPSSKQLKGGEYGCFKISGNTSAPIDSYNLSVFGTAWVKVANNPIKQSGNFSAIFPIKLRVINAGDACYGKFPTALEELTEKGLSMRLFPNPNQGKFTLSLQSSSANEISLTVINAIGSTVRSEKCDINGSLQKQLDLSKLPSGFYFLQIQDGKTKQTRKFVIE